MRKLQALKLHNRDEVLVKTCEGWRCGYVLGEPQTNPDGTLLIPTQTREDGFSYKYHTEVR